MLIDLRSKSETVKKVLWAFLTNKINPRTAGATAGSGRKFAEEKLSSRTSALLTERSPSYGGDFSLAFTRFEMTASSYLNDIALMMGLFAFSLGFIY